ncbi:MAG: hypothetical protein IJ504_01335 [Bacteroidales bacterium]|nr:hypothetical protein [Bacteroidales bacterium]
MRRITRILVTLALIVAGMCHTTKPAKADMFGVSDTALLVQQVLQFFQDMDISQLSDMNFSELIKGLEDKTRDLQKMVNIFENGQKGIQTFNNVVEVTRKLTRTTLRINNYIKYLGTMGDDFEITRCYFIYRSFNSKTKLVLSDMESTLRSIKKLDSTEGSDMLRVMNDIIEGASSTIDVISDECITTIADEIHEYKMRKQGEKANEMVNLVIC